MATPPITTWDELRAALGSPWFDLTTPNQLSVAVKLLARVAEGMEQQIKALEARVKQLESETPYRG